MLRQHERNAKAKAVNSNIEVYDGNNELVRVIASAMLDGFADDIDLPDGSEAYNIDIIPVRVRGVEAAWTEGAGETFFVWDCRNEMGEPVKQGVYRVDLKQSDSFGRISTVSAVISIKEKKAA